MAIQIDLLPQYVGLRRKVKVAALFMFVIYVIAGTAFTLVWDAKTKEVKTAKANTELYRPIAQKAADTKKLADDKDASLIPMATSVKFCSDASQTGPRRAAVINMLRWYINKDSLVSVIDIPDGKSVNITAAVTDTEHYANLLLNLRKGWTGHQPPSARPAIFDAEPKASGAPGYPKVPLPNIPFASFGQLVEQPFPLNVNISTSLTEPLKFETPLALGEAAVAAAPGQPGAAPAGGSTPTGGSGGAPAGGSSSPTPIQ